jgi:hypothetical protein
VGIAGEDDLDAPDLSGQAVRARQSSVALDRGGGVVNEKIMACDAAVIPAAFGMI